MPTRAATFFNFLLALPENCAFKPIIFFRKFFSAGIWLHKITFKKLIFFKECIATKFPNQNWKIGSLANNMGDLKFQRSTDTHYKRLKKTFYFHAFCILNVILLCRAVFIGNSQRHRWQMAFPLTTSTINNRLDFVTATNWRVSWLRYTQNDFVFSLLSFS